MEDSARHPIRDALTNLATSSHTDVDLRELLYHPGGVGSAGSADKRASVEEKVMVIVAEEGGDVSVVPDVPLPVSSATVVGPTRFAAWDE